MAPALSYGAYAFGIVSSPLKREKGGLRARGMQSNVDGTNPTRRQN